VVASIRTRVSNYGLVIPTRMENWTTQPEIHPGFSDYLSSELMLINLGEELVSSDEIFEGQNIPGKIFRTGETASTYRKRV
jgi:hypothetical protein